MHVAAHRKTLLAGLWLVLIGVIVQAYLSLAPLAHAWKPDQLDLAGSWELCQPESQATTGCAWSQTQAPAKLTSEQRSRLPGWLVYRRTFTAPQSCFQQSEACSLIIGEVGDAVEAQLNGVVIGRHGDFPPHPRYARQYPAKFDISRDILKSGRDANAVELTVYATKKTQAGIGSGPLGIFSSGQGFLIAKLIVTLNVVLPITGFVALFFMGLIPALTGLVARRRDGRLDSFIGYCFAWSFFLLSFSETPREWLPIWVAGYIHFLTRIIGDWAYFEMVQTYYDLGAKWRKLGRPGYLTIIAAFLVMLVVDGFGGKGRTTGFDTAYLIMRAAFPLLLLPHIAGMIGAWRNRAAFAGRVFIALFTITLAMQVHDCLIFHGFITGVYAVKIYPVFIGAAFGWLMLERYREERERLAVADGIAQVATQVAHDIQAPLWALEGVAWESAVWSRWP